MEITGEVGRGDASRDGPYRITVSVKGGNLCSPPIGGFVAVFVVERLDGEMLTSALRSYQSGYVSSSPSVGFESTDQAIAEGKKRASNWIRIESSGGGMLT